jgi:hypothetical protein
MRTGNRYRNLPLSKGIHSCSQEEVNGGEFEAGF